MQTPPPKRQYPFNEDETAESPRKRPTPPILAGLSDADYEALERVAALLNVPVAQLLPDHAAVETVRTTSTATAPEDGNSPVAMDRTPVLSLQDTALNPRATSDMLDAAISTDGEAVAHPNYAAWDDHDLGPDDPQYDDSWAQDYQSVVASAPGLLHSRQATDAAASSREPSHSPRDLARIAETPAFDAELIAPARANAATAADYEFGPWGRVAANQLAKLPSSWTDLPSGATSTSPPLSTETPSDVSSALEVISWDPCGTRSAPPQQQRASFTDLKKKEETANTRKLKACVRCRMQKIRCLPNLSDPNGPCLTCAAATVRKIHTLACLRYKITECTLYRSGKGPGLAMTVRWRKMKLKDISDWAAPDVATIQVLSDVCAVPLEFKVRKFVPIPHDSLTRGWMDGGVKKFLKIKPYAITNMQRAVDDMRAYINKNVFECMDHFLQNSDDFVKETYAFAKKHMVRVKSEDERKLMTNFFRLWFGIRRTATSEHIVDGSQLDIPEVTDTSFFLHGKVPLPPVMIHQLDMILTLGILNPLQKQVLEDVQKIFLENKPKSWLTLYLITFMMLHSCASLSGENYRNARRQGLRRRYAIPQFISEHHHSANVFLSHYHYCTKPCNPFTMNWKRRQTTRFADYTPDEIHFLMRTKEFVAERANVMRFNKECDLYEDDLYFIAQMFEEDWTPRDSYIDFDGGTINNVPLKIYYGDPEFEEVTTGANANAPVVTVK